MRVKKYDFRKLVWVFPAKDPVSSTLIVIKPFAVTVCGQHQSQIIFEHSPKSLGIDRVRRPLDAETERSYIQQSG